MADDALVLATRVVRALRQKQEKKTEKKKMPTKTAEELNLLGAIAFGRALAERDLEPFKLAYLKGTTVKTAAAAAEWLKELEQLTKNADAADVAREHPYLSTVPGPRTAVVKGQGQERETHKKRASLGSAYDTFAQTLPEDQRESFFKIAEKVNDDVIRAAAVVLPAMGR
jgi:hypothetical protein